MLMHKRVGLLAFVVAAALGMGYCTIYPADTPSVTEKELCKESGHLRLLNALRSAEESMLRRDIENQQMLKSMHDGGVSYDVMTEILAKVFIRLGKTSQDKAQIPLFETWTRRFREIVAKGISLFGVFLKAEHRSVNPESIDCSYFDISTFRMRTFRCSYVDIATCLTLTLWCIYLTKCIVDNWGKVSSCCYCSGSLGYYFEMEELFGGLCSRKIGKELKKLSGDSELNAIFGYDLEFVEWVPRSCCDKNEYLKVKQKLEEGLEAVRAKLSGEQIASLDNLSARLADYLAEVV